jgi:hypothetical protein
MHASPVLRSLQEMIRQLAAEGRAEHMSICAARGLERHAAWRRKRAIGRRARAHLLAYGLLRDRPRALAEATRDEESAWVRTVLAREVGAVLVALDPALTKEEATARAERWLAADRERASLR